MNSNVVSFPSIPKSTLDSQLRFAIANKHLIRLSYEGATRVVEPHDYGLRKGLRKVLVYQRERAGRRDREVRGWRWLDTVKIEECVVLEQLFSGTREAAGQQHHRWDVLFARVDHTS
jgi:hypothetical protein